MTLPRLPTPYRPAHTDGECDRPTLYSEKQMQAYGQACFFEGGFHEVETINEMQAVADRYAHRLALELECVLADRPGYYNSAMQVLSQYRSAMNAIHEQHCPTFMGEPVIGGIEP